MKHWSTGKPKGNINKQNQQQKEDKKRAYLKYMNTKGNKKPSQYWNKFTKEIETHLYEAQRKTPEMLRTK